MIRETEIGEIISVSGNVISVQLSDTVKSNMPVIKGVVYKIGQIGSFVKIPLGYAYIYGVVTQIGAAATPERLRIEEDSQLIANYQYMNVALLGEQIGRKFERGVSQSPTIGDKVHLVTIEDLSIIYGGFDDRNSIVVGNISISSNLDARIDLDKLTTRHCAILGSTGSGKSNAVGVLLKSIADKDFKSSRILVIDPHGEYNSVLKNKSIVFKIRANKTESELQIPYWALPFEELLAIFSGNLLDTNKDYLRTEIEKLKVEAAKVNAIDIPVELITADTPIPFSIRQLWYNLDRFERLTFKQDRITPALIKEGDPGQLLSAEFEPPGIGASPPYLNNARKGLLTFLDGMRLKLKDSTYNFLFNSFDYTPDLSGKVKCDLADLLYSWLGGDKPITILDMSGIPTEVMVSISGTLLKIIYDALFWGQELSIGGKQQPLLVVLEEAHNYLKAGEKSISSKTIQSIAKEGRKYGVGLVLVTQRPSELDDTVLSQCGTILALRMNNAKDRGFIRSAMQDELQTLVDLLPSLRVGEGVISGEGVKMPSRVQFYKLSDAPKGADPKVSERWMVNADSSVEKYKDLLYLWRNQIFNK